MVEDAIRIAKLADLEPSPALQARLDAIFFAASGRTFAPGSEREAFRQRWLGRYLQGGNDIVLLALDARGTLAGYVAGAVENPALQERFSDIAYFRGDFAGLCGRYPAHLHINLAPEFRNRGIGARLIEAFAAAARSAGAPGLHVVTGEGMRNVHFYERCGLTEQGRAPWNGGTVVLLARSL
jgi:GNAT superfamily N-acetyltransferase